MHILVINSGSSSIKFSLFDAAASELRSLLEGELTGIGGSNPQFEFHGADGSSDAQTLDQVSAATPSKAIGLIAQAVRRPGLPHVEAVGYRVVHPGPALDRHQKINEQVLSDLQQAVVFAPLHDPEAIAVIRETMSLFPGIGHYACFDTVFHQNMPPAAITYPIPQEYRDQGVRRYGFHGLSCESIVRQLRAEETIPFPRRMIVAHLGSGCSVTAVVDGRSLDTSMGLTPTGGVVMGTRPGDLDPGLVLYLLRQLGGDSIAKLEKMLNHDAGMVALSGLPNDMKALRAAAAGGNAKALLAAEIFTRSVKKSIGAFAALMGGLDALVFAGGIGEHDVLSRQEIASGLESFGVCLDSVKNRSAGDAVRSIGASDSVSAVLVVPAQEDRMIALHVHRLAQSQSVT